MNTRDCPQPLRKRLKRSMRALNMARTRWLNAGRPDRGPSSRRVRLRAATCLQLLMVFGDIERQRKEAALTYQVESNGLVYTYRCDGEHPGPACPAEMCYHRADGPGRAFTDDELCPELGELAAATDPSIVSGEIDWRVM